MEWIKTTLSINGYDVHAQYTKENVETILMPFIERMQTIYRQKKRRIFVYLVAPPACGKSTLAAYLCLLSKQMGYDNVQCIGMDGFHYPNEYLDYHFVAGGLLRDFKGCPQSFDIKKLTRYIQETKDHDCTWPQYDRSIHNPKEHAVLIDRDIVIIEGNYLLIDMEQWRDLRAYCDLSMFIEADIDLLKKRLLQRKCMGGATLQEAQAFYANSEQKNIHLVVAHTMDADVHLTIDQEGVFHSLL